MSGKVVAQVVPDVKKHTLAPFMAKMVSRNATLLTDEFPTYDTVARFGYKHKMIDLLT
ncbi:transposase [Chloroflexota bacterium]